MDSGKLITAGDNHEKEETSELDELIAKDSVNETHNRSLVLADETDTEEEAQAGPSSAGDVRKTMKSTSSQITAEVEISDSAGLRKRSTVDVATNDVPSSSSQSTFNANDDLKEPTAEAAPLHRTVTPVRLSQSPVERESNALLLCGVYILITEMVSQGIAGIISSIGLALGYSYTFFAEEFWELLCLCIVAVLSLIFQCGLWYGTSMEDIRANYLQCLVLPNLPLWCVAIFILLRFLIYIVLCILLESVWFTYVTIILTVIVNIPAFCIICCEKLISRTIRMVLGLGNDSAVQHNENR